MLCSSRSHLPTIGISSNVTTVVKHPLYFRYLTGPSWATSINHTGYNTNRGVNRFLTSNTFLQRWSTWSRTLTTHWSLAQILFCGNKTAMFSWLNWDKSWGLGKPATFGLCYQNYREHILYSVLLLQCHAVTLDTRKSGCAKSRSLLPLLWKSVENENIFLTRHCRKD
jgi:hypothetical protein